MEHTFEPMSLTKMTKYINEKANRNYSKEILLAFLVKRNYVKDIRTISEYGQENGVRYESKADGSARWPVYNKHVVELLLANVAEMDNMGDQRPPAPAPKSSYNSTNRRTSTANRVSTMPKSIQKNDNFDFPYLGLDNFVILDTEGTGLKLEDEVIEIGIIDTNGNVLYESTFYPQREVDYFATKVNGFTKANLTGSPQLKDEWRNIVKAIGGKKILCHNTAYDKRILIQSFKLYDIDYDIESCFDGACDSLEIAKKWINSKSYKLEHLANLMGINEKEEHRASSDCLMTLKFLRKLEEAIRLREEVLK